MLALMLSRMGQHLSYQCPPLLGAPPISLTIDCLFQKQPAFLRRMFIYPQSVFYLAPFVNLMWQLQRRENDDVVQEDECGKPRCFFWV